MFYWKQGEIMHVLVKFVCEEPVDGKWTARAILPIKADSFNFESVLLRIRKMVANDLKFKRFAFCMSAKLEVRFEQLEIGNELLQLATNGLAEVAPGCRMFWELVGHN